jgi:hypothetical protein
MPLQGLRFAGDPWLESLLDGDQRMLHPDDGLAVMRVQSALVELGEDVGPGGLDGQFGPGTGDAVSRYKQRHALSPADPVVGVGTMGALDADLIGSDAVFGLFAPYVADHRIEPFVARELSDWIATPLGPWRPMIALWALGALDNTLLGVVARGRAEDLRAGYSNFATDPQPSSIGPIGAQAMFDSFLADPAVGVPARLDLGDSVPYASLDFINRVYVVINDLVFMRRGMSRWTGTGVGAPFFLSDALAHELTHARNIENRLRLLATADNDDNVFLDTALAPLRSAISGVPTAECLRAYVEEICARHVNWITRQELSSNPTGPANLSPESLVAAARFYFVDFQSIADVNGYVGGIITQGDGAIYSQIAMWLRQCATYSFTDDPNEQGRTEDLFISAAQFCDTLVDNPVNPAAPDGLYPLQGDFTEVAP